MKDVNILNKKSKDMINEALMALEKKTWTKSPEYARQTINPH